MSHKKSKKVYWCHSKQIYVKPSYCLFSCDWETPFGTCDRDFNKLRLVKENVSNVYK